MLNNNINNNQNLSSPFGMDLISLNLLINMKPCMGMIESLKNSHQVFSSLDRNSGNYSLHQTPRNTTDFFRKLGQLGMDGFYEQKEQMNSLLSIYNCETNMLPDLQRQNMSMSSIRTLTDPQRTITSTSMKQLTKEITSIGETKGEKDLMIESLPFASEFTNERTDTMLTKKRKKEKSIFVLIKNCLL